MRTHQLFFRTILILTIFCKLTSCVNTRPIQYLQGQFDTASLSRYVIKEPVVQIGDLISIVVYSDNPAASALYNLPNVGGVQGSSTTSGYLVDPQGNIQLQSIGNLQVAGLTKQQLTDLLNSRLTQFLQNPYYNIRFLNYKFTMLGEVNKEGVYNIVEENINIMQAIGLAGGLTVFARRENVMLIREANGRREFARLDLTKPELLQSPYYYLQKNDMIVVEQTKDKQTSRELATTRNVSFVGTIISTIAIIYTVFRR